MKKNVFRISFLFCTLFFALTFSRQTQAATQYAKDGFYYEKEYGKAYICGYYGNDSTMKIPSKIDGCTVVRINSVRDNGPYGNTYDSVVENIIMPDTITEIKSVWNFNSNKLKTVRLSAKLKELDGANFRNSPNLTTVTNGTGIEYLGFEEFSNTGLTSIDFPNLKQTGLSTFKDCKNLTSVNCPKLAIPGYNTFSGCSSLKTVKLSPQLQEINLDMFYGCSSLTSFKIPASCKKISGNAFSQTSLTNISIPSTVELLSGSVFKDCTKLTSATINSRGPIRIQAFDRCINLSSVEIGSGVTEIWGNAFRGCVSLKSIAIPPNVSKIENSAFSECENLMEIRGTKGTAAEAFAKKLGVKFTVIKPNIIVSASSEKLYPVAGFNTKTLKVKREGTLSTVKFVSSNTKIATVNSKGVITAKKKGTATITITCGSLKKAYRVQVYEPALKITSKTSGTLYRGKTTTIKALSLPAGKLTYTSSNKNIATVNSRGVVLAKQKGTCYITVSIGGVSKKVKVMVK